MIKRYKWWIICLLLLIFVWQFRRSKTINTSMVNAKVADFAKYEQLQYENQCKIQALQTASHIVDSILIAQSYITSFDTSGRPSTPMRPEAQKFKSKLDDVPLRPLWDDEKSNA
jgi:hypothetical protein